MSEKSTSKIDEKQLRVVQQDCKAKQENIWLKVEEFEYTRKHCWLMFDSFCDSWRKEEEIKDALSKSTGANFKVEMLQWKFGENSSMKDEIAPVLAKLKNETKQLRDLEQILSSDSSTVSSLIRDIESTEPLSLEEIQDKWQYFEFSSTSKSNGTLVPVAYKHLGSILSLGHKPFAFSRHRSFASYIQNANVLLKAKVLKVNINRPWFRESLFHNRHLKLVSYSSCQ